MKTLTLLLFVSIIAFIALCVTAPDDAKMISEVKRHYGLQLDDAGIVGEVVNEFTDQGAGMVWRVENHVVYKTVVNRLDGQCVAYGLLGFVNME
jgi:uncharacterized protein (DUF697 family)